MRYRTTLGKLVQLLRVSLVSSHVIVLKEKNEILSTQDKVLICKALPGTMRGRKSRLREGTTKLVACSFLESHRPKDESFQAQILGTSQCLSKKERMRKRDLRQLTTKTRNLPAGRNQRIQAQQERQCPFQVAKGPSLHLCMAKKRTDDPEQSLCPEDAYQDDHGQEEGQCDYLLQENKKRSKEKE